MDWRTQALDFGAVSVMCTHSRRPHLRQLGRWTCGAIVAFMQAAQSFKSSGVCMPVSASSRQTRSGSTLVMWEATFCHIECCQSASRSRRVFVLCTLSPNGLSIHRFSQERRRRQDWVAGPRVIFALQQKMSS